jgi:hypothetical protein
MASRVKVNANGRPIYGTDGKPIREAIPMVGARLHNGAPQDLYFPLDHLQYPGRFKGIVNVLLEHGYRDAEKLQAQCGSFKCVPGISNCCCRRILYNEPDFMAVESKLETLCHAHNVRLLFLPKFHCELNPIEQCWGYAKRVYREYPKSTKESDLEMNVVKALALVPLDSIRR